MKKVIFIMFGILFIADSAFAGEKILNLKTNTFSFPFGASIELEYKLTKHISASPMFLKYSFPNFGSSSAYGIGVGAGLSWYFDEAIQQGYFVGGSAIIMKNNYEESLSEVYTGTSPATIICASYGRMWLWDFLNVSASMMYCNLSEQAYMLTAPSGNTIYEQSANGSTIFPMLSIGYAW